MESLQHLLLAPFKQALLVQAWWLLLPLAFLGGLLSSLSPCIYPVIPLTVRYFGTNTQEEARYKFFLRILIYIGGMIFFYATLGTLGAASTKLFGSLLAHRWLLTALAIFCSVMGLATLGLFSFSLPSKFHTALSLIQGLDYTSALLMGLVSGLIAAPCIGPILAVILALIATNPHGSLLLGFSLMSAFALGLSLPLGLLALLSHRLTKLPTTSYLAKVSKIILALAMLLTAFYFLQIAWPQLKFWQPDHLKVEHTEKFPEKLTGELTAAATGAELANQTQQAIAWRSYKEGLEFAKNQHLPIMLEVTASWCLACKQLAKTVFTDPLVKQEARRFSNIQIDATLMTKELQDIFHKYQIVGLPAIIFINSAGEVRDNTRIFGNISAKEFLQVMRQVH